MKTIGNVLWFVLCGFWAALGWLFSAVVLAVFVVTLPLARQCVKMAQFSAWPFGRQAVPSANAVGPSGVWNAVWFVFGLIIAIILVIGGLLLCITVIGIPFGLQSFKLAGLALRPFGREIVRTKDLKANWAA